MKKVLSYVKFYKKESILSPLLKMAEALLELLVPIVMASVIDRGIANGDKPYVVKLCILLVLVGAIGLAMSVQAQYYAAKASVGISSKLRHSLFSHIHTLSYSELDKIGDSTLISRMTNDINQVQNGINLTLRLLLRSPFVVFGAMTMAFIVDFNASLIFVITIPLLFLVVFSIMTITIPMYKKVQQKIDTIFMRTDENLEGIRVIRAFCKEKKEAEKFGLDNDTLATRQKQVGRISALLNPLTYVIINISIAVLLWQSGLRIDAGKMSQGEAIALYNYMSQILIELIKMANLIISITKAIACANRIEKVLITQPSVVGGGTKQDGESPFSIQMRNVNLAYTNTAANSLSDINISIKRGETVGIIGGTGSGKSSLINLIPRFYDASSGEVVICGVNVREYDLAYLRSKVGIVPQRVVLFRGSIRDNIKKGNPSATDEDIENAMRVAQAGDILETKGLDFMIEENGKNLSGGQRQRLTIARAIVRNPEILILDDSASALDFATDSALRKAIDKQKQNRTVIIVSQRTSAVANADKIIVMDNGKIVAQDMHENLLKSCDLYREIYESQFKKEDKR